MVDLPAPFGPRKARDLFLNNGEVYTVERTTPVEVFHQLSRHRRDLYLARCCQSPSEWSRRIGDRDGPTPRSRAGLLPQRRGAAAGRGCSPAPSDLRGDYSGPRSPAGWLRSCYWASSSARSSLVSGDRLNTPTARS